MRYTIILYDESNPTVSSPSSNYVGDEKQSIVISLYSGVATPDRKSGPCIRYVQDDESSAEPKMKILPNVTPDPTTQPQTKPTPEPKTLPRSKT